jgi:hypothetical protein
MTRCLQVLLLLFPVLLSAIDYDVYAGPHFNYTRVQFNNPSSVEGYQAGVSAGVVTYHCGYFASVDFEGTWDAGPVTGRPCQRSCLSEYFLELKIGRGCCLCGFEIEPYLGVGWDRFQNRQDPGAADLLYRYDKVFIPLGFYVRWPVYGWCCGLHFEWRPDVWSQLELIGIDLNPSWGHGFRVQLPCQQQIHICRRLTLELVPFFDWNRFGAVRVRNSSGATLTIPRLWRLNAGLRALVGYTF